MSKIKLFILDDHQMLVDGIKALLHNENAFTIVGEATKASIAIELIKKNTPDIVLSDINMPEMNGIEFTRLLKKNHPEIKVLVLSMFGERSTISEMLDAGASGYILKNTGREELVKAITMVSKGFEYFSEEVVHALESNPVNDEKINTVHLIEREIDIIDCISKEMTNPQIAETLFISERTVETHRKNIFRKTGIKGVVGLVKFALDKGFIK